MPPFSLMSVKRAKLGVPNLDKIQQKQGSEEWLMKVQFSGNVTELLSKEASIKIHSGPENFRKVQATKNSWNKMNQFRRSFLILENWNCILISQLFPKIIFSWRFFILNYLGQDFLNFLTCCVAHVLEFHFCACCLTSTWLGKFLWQSLSWVMKSNVRLKKKIPIGILKMFFLFSGIVQRFSAALFWGEMLFTFLDIQSWSRMILMAN